MQIAINEANMGAIVTSLVQAAGRATLSTILTRDAFESAWETVKNDLERRFPVPESTNFKVIFTPWTSGCALTSELTFLRLYGDWYFQNARNRRPIGKIFTRHPAIKYVVGAWEYEVFKGIVRDGRSMQSIERSEWRPLSAHERLRVHALHERVPPPRRGK